MNQLRVLVIGIDGMSWNVVRDLTDSEVLPTLKHLIENGVTDILESTYPPWTVPARSSICSGLSPKKLGYVMFMIPSSNYVPMPHLHVVKEPWYVWDYLSISGHKVIVVNVPNVYSAYKVNGIIISGWLYRDRKRLAYPSEVIEELKRVCGNYIVDIYEVNFEEGRIIKSPTFKELASKVLEMLNNRICVYKYLLSKYDWNFAFLVFVALDRIQHAMYENKELIAHVYKQIDDALKELLKISGEDTVTFIISDHGFGRSEKCFKVNLWLMNEGFLRINWGYLIRLAFIKSMRKLLHVITKRCGSSFLLKVYDHICTIHERLMKDSNIKLINWEKTKAFSLGVWGDIYINLKGKFTEGTVDEHEYSKIVNDIIDRLKKQIPHAQVLSKVHAYGDCGITSHLPDIIIIPSDEGIQSIDPYLSLRDIIYHRGVHYEVRKGEHRLEGVFICHGPSIKRGYRLKKVVRTQDIVPTVLHIFNLPIPSDIEGRVLKEIFEPTSMFALREPKFVDKSYYTRLNLARRARELRERIS